jgi:hypothetical protein
MRRFLAAMSSFLLLTTGCGGIHYVDLTDDETDVDGLNRSLSRASATVHLKDGVRLRSKHLSLDPECAAFTIRAPAARDTTLRTWDIDKITVGGHARGALVGSLGGLLAGAIFGALLSASSYSDEDENFLVPTRGDAAGLGAIFGGVIGFGIGLVVGGMVGVEDVYYIRTRSFATDCE